MNEKVDDLEGIFSFEGYGEERQEELRRVFWNYLFRVPHITSAERHTLVRRLVDEASFGTIASELGMKAQNVHKAYKQGVKKVRQFDEQS